MKIWIQIKNPNNSVKGANMKKFISIILIITLLFSIIACSGQGKLIKDTPEQGQSLVIYTKDGKIHEGLFIKKDDERLIFIDKDSHKAETIENSDISKVIESKRYYDFEGNEITDSNISSERGYSRTAGYGVGGLFLGAAVGFGVGIILQKQEIAAPLVPMVALGLGGAYFFADMGYKSDTEVAIKTVRDRRFAKSKDKFEKELEETKKLIEAKKKEKVRLQNEIENTKKDKK
jgi:hypothetical protein